MRSELQAETSRENGAKSRGPVTPEGKQKVSQNAVKHGLCGETHLLRTDDVAAYDKLVAIIFKKWGPETDAEKLVVQAIAIAEWRLLKISVIEDKIWASSDEAEDVIFRQNQKELHNLRLNEGKIQRQLERKVKEFKELRAEREIVQTAHINKVIASVTTEGVKPMACVGFEFSWEYLVARQTFTKFAPLADPVHFDRAWSNKSLKMPN